LQTFDTQYGLPVCTSNNGCFIKHKMSGFTFANSGWILEESLDVQWAHALAPNAKVLLVEARSSRLSDLLSAVSYAKSYPGVVSVSMSWGSGEFSGLQTYDSYFSQPGVTFFASSGDSGTGVQWPAVSANVIGVGGTTLTLVGSSVSAETAWNGSGGGISQFVSEPSFQSLLVTNSHGMRGVPDVSFDADPTTGVAVYDSYGYSGQRGWFELGGTSVGSPSWAAVNALGHSVSNTKLYQDAVSAYTTDFRDITSGTNGSCGSVCTATTGYDFITGLGSPLTFSY
ncbi:MAG: S53 family peptidase, partial [Patescibacteria group bacterium]|nr:S53 family peptidase [Patescibacteria group bacterium]